MDLTSKIGKEIAHPLIGTLPEQQWFEDHISWYNSDKGIRSSTSMEAILGVGYFALIALEFSFTDHIIVESILAGYMTGDGYGRLILKSGTIALEIPWTIGKGIFKGGSYLAEGILFYLDNNHWD